MGNTSNIRKTTKDYFSKKRNGRPDYDVFALETFNNARNCRDIHPGMFVLPKLHVRIYGAGTDKVLSIVKEYESIIDRYQTSSDSEPVSSLQKILEEYGLKLNLRLFTYLIESEDEVQTNCAGLHYVFYDNSNRQSFILAEQILNKIRESPRCHYGLNKYIALVAINDPSTNHINISDKEGINLASKYIADFFVLNNEANGNNITEIIESLVREYLDDELRHFEKKRQEVFEYIEEQRRRASIHEIVNRTTTQSS